MRFFPNLAFVLLGHFTFAQQTLTISGTVVDENNTKVGVGDMLLYNATETELLQYTFLSDGTFAFLNLAPGDYVLRISALGFADTTRSLQVSKTISLRITLVTKAEKLEEVEVTTLKNPITNENGNLKIDVQNPIFSAIPEPLDVLAKLPNMQIAPNRESVTVLGKGRPLIYLGNQRIDFEEFIALSVDAIASIELINNPSARYEASGRAVLKVTLKQKTASNTMTLTETASKKRNFNNYLSTNANFKLGKVNFRGNLSYNQLGPWESNTFEFEIPERTILTDYLVLIPDTKRREFNGGLGSYFPLKRAGYLSLNTTFRLQQNTFPIETDTFVRDGAGENDIITDTQNARQRDYVTVNFNFERPLNQKWTLFSGLQFSNFLDGQKAEISNNVNGAGFVLDQSRDQEYRINSLAFRADFTATVSEHTKWEMGLNCNVAWANAFSDFQNIQIMEANQVYFEYLERIYATYLAFASRLGKKINYDISIRSEYNQVNSAVENEATPLLERERTNLFPRINASVAVDSTKTVSLNYAKSINRPNFSRTSTISTFINPFLEGVGNINLQPSITDEVSGTLQWKNKSISIGYNRTQRPSNFTIGYDEQANVAVFLLENQEKESGFFANLVVPLTKGIWNSTNSIGLFYNKIEDEKAVVGTAKPYVYAYSNHQLKIAKDTTLAVGAWALTKRQEGIFKRNAMVVADATVSQTVLKKLRCSLRFNDIFRSMNFEEAYAIDGVFAKGTYFADAQEVAISLKYRFGDAKKNDFKNRDIDENLDRIN